MEIISRAEAKRNGQKTYFTGKPCANDHIAYRYTQSGTCSKCINGNHNRGTDPIAEARKEAKAQMVQVRIRVRHIDRENVAAGVWALAVMRFPMLTQGDVDPRLIPQDKGPETGMYAFLCHEEDIGAVRALGLASINRPMVDLQAGRRKAFGAAADVPVAPVPDWARIPRPGDPDYK